MPLTSAQYAALKADILASPDMASQPMTSAGALTIADLYNAASTTDVWRTDAPAQAIYDAIDWSKFTPVDAADGTTIYTNRLLLIQTKQMNLTNILQGRSTVDASKANLRAGLRDAVIALPAGVSGAAVAAGGVSGVNVLNACLRKATRFEKLFATNTATTGSVTANLLVLEGQVSVDDIQIARES
jgi:hypothetical protein